MKVIDGHVYKKWRMVLYHLQTSGKHLDLILIIKYISQSLSSTFRNPYMTFIFVPSKTDWFLTRKVSARKEVQKQSPRFFQTFHKMYNLNLVAQLKYNC